LSATSASTTFGSNTVGDGTDRRHELVEIADALLQEVGAAFAASLEECEHVARDGMLAEDDDPDTGTRLAQSCGGLDALVCASRRHPDVGDDDVGPLGVDRVEQRREVFADRDDLQVALCVEQAPETLSDEILVLREHDPDGHRVRIRR
jgi:hypothetical protein